MPYYYWLEQSMAAIRGALRTLDSDGAIVSVTIAGGEVVTRESAARRIAELDECLRQPYRLTVHEA
jgi:hypothetical protein